MKKKLFWLFALSLLAWTCNQQPQIEIMPDTIYLRQHELELYEIFSLPKIDSIKVCTVINDQVFFKVIENGCESETKVMNYNDFIIGIETK